MNTIQLAGCVILDDHGRLLLLHRQTRDYDHWEIPGGKVESGESSGDAASRELLEELGLHVKLLKELGAAEFVDRERRFAYTWWRAESADVPMLQEPELFAGYDYLSLEELSKGQISVSKGLEMLLELVKSQQITL